MRSTIFFIFILAGFLASCQQSRQDAGFEKSDSGLRYKFHYHSEDKQAQIGDILKLEMIYRLNNDSVIFSSIDMNHPVYLELMEPEFPGDIYEGFALMSQGDSATFIINAEDFFKRTARMPELPPFANASDDIFFEVKLLAAMNEEEYMEDQMRAAESLMEENLRRADQEDVLLQEFLNEKGITTAARESGLIIVEKQAGTGARVQAGNTVSVHYEGKLLDGTVFDSSLERGEPIEFQAGVGQVIAGWDEGITAMRVGGKAQLIIPSYLAYGEHGAGNVIPPFSTLVFEVEIVDAR